MFEDDFDLAWRRADHAQRDQMVVDAASVGRVDLLKRIRASNHSLAVKEGMPLWVCAAGLHVEAVKYLLEAVTFDPIALNFAYSRAGQAWLENMEYSHKECARRGRATLTMIKAKAVDFDEVNAALIREASFMGQCQMVDFFLEEADCGLRYAFSGVSMAEKGGRPAVIERFLDAGFDPSPFPSLVMANALFDARRLADSSEASKKTVIIKPVISRRTY